MLEPIRYKGLVKKVKELSDCFWAELKRRGVVRVTIFYLTGGLLLYFGWTQVKDWGVTQSQCSSNILLGALVIGLILVLLLAWNWARIQKNNVLVAVAATIILGYLGGISMLVLGFFGIAGWTDDIDKLCEKFYNSAIFTETSNYKILLIPLKAFSNEKNIKLEQDLAVMLQDKNEKEKLGMEIVIDSSVASPFGFRKAGEIGRNKGADLVIWGYFYETDSGFTETDLRYVVVDTTYFPLRIEAIPMDYKSDELVKISGMHQIYQGTLKKNVDHIIYWAKGFESIQKSCQNAKYYFFKSIKAFPEENYLVNYLVATCFTHFMSYDSALHYFDISIQQNSNFALSYNNRGYVFSKINNVDQAIRNYTKSIELDSSWSSFFNRAREYFVSNDYSNALDDFNKSITLNPKFYEAYALRSTIYFLLGNEEEQYQDISTMISLEPTQPHGYFMRGMYYYYENKSNAIDDFNRAIEIDPSSFAPYYARGTLFYELGNFPGALSSILHLLKNLM